MSSLLDSLSLQQKGCPLCRWDKDSPLISTSLRSSLDPPAGLCFLLLLLLLPPLQMRSSPAPLAFSFLLLPLQHRSRVPPSQLPLLLSLFLFLDPSVCPGPRPSGRGRRQRLLQQEGRRCLGARPAGRHLSTPATCSGQPKRLDTATLASQVYHAVRLSAGKLWSDILYFSFIFISLFITFLFFKKYLIVFAFGVVCVWSPPPGKYLAL